MRQSLIALAPGSSGWVSTRTTSDVVYYVGLIGWVGCHVDAYEQAKWFGDDLALKGDARRVDLASCARHPC